jgi:hypothetical protein
MNANYKLMIRADRGEGDLTFIIFNSEFFIFVRFSQFLFLLIVDLTFLFHVSFYK